MTENAQGDILSCRACIHMHVSWQVSLIDFHTSHTSFRRLSDHRLLLPYHHGGWKLHCHFTLQINAATRLSYCREAEFLGVRYMGVQSHKIINLYRRFLLYLLTECLIHHTQSCRTRD